MTQPKLESDDIRKMRILWAAHLFVNNDTRSAAKIASTTGMTVTEVFELASLPIWRKALEYFGYTGEKNIKNLSRYRKRHEIRVGDLKRAEKLWGVLISEDSHINPPVHFTGVYREVFGEANDTE